VAYVVAHQWKLSAKNAADPHVHGEQVGLGQPRWGTYTAHPSLPSRRDTAGAKATNCVCHAVPLKRRQCCCNKGVLTTYSLRRTLAHTAPLGEDG
jgi:hypothetical protein